MRKRPVFGRASAEACGKAGWPSAAARSLFSSILPEGVGNLRSANSGTGSGESSTVAFSFNAAKPVSPACWGKRVEHRCIVFSELRLVEAHRARQATEDLLIGQRLADRRDRRGLHREPEMEIGRDDVVELQEPRRGRMKSAKSVVSVAKQSIATWKRSSRFNACCRSAWRGLEAAMFTFQVISARASCGLRSTSIRSIWLALRFGLARRCGASI